jgi:hypothetical protein
MVVEDTGDVDGQGRQPKSLHKQEFGSAQLATDQRRPNHAKIGTCP